METDANGPYFGLINGHVQFEGYSRGGHSPHSYSWDFGDTHTSDEQNPLHTYTNPGNYTVTVTVTDNTNNSTSDSTWAWIQESNYPPDKPIMKGKYRVLPAITYNYKLKAIDPEEYLIWYYIKWGDGTTSDWIGPYDSDVEITVGHYFTKGGRYTIISKAKDGYGAESNWSDPLCLSIPRTRASNLWYQWFLDRFLLLEKLLNLIRVI